MFAFSPHQLSGLLTVGEGPPPPGSQAAFVAWGIRPHNLVNIHLGKPMWAWPPFIPHGCPSNLLVPAWTFIFYMSPIRSQKICINYIYLYAVKYNA